MNYNAKPVITEKLGPLKSYDLHVYSGCYIPLIVGRVNWQVWIYFHHSDIPFQKHNFNKIKLLIFVILQSISEMLDSMMVASFCWLTCPTKVYCLSFVFSHLPMLLSLHITVLFLLQTSPYFCEAFIWFGNGFKCRLSLVSISSFICLFEGEHLIMCLPMQAYQT